MWWLEEATCRSLSYMLETNKKQKTNYIKLYSIIYQHFSGLLIFQWWLFKEMTTCAASMQWHVFLCVRKKSSFTTWVHHHLPAEYSGSRPICWSTSWSVPEPGGWYSRSSRCIIYRGEHQNTQVFLWQRVTHLFLILMQLLHYVHGRRRLPTGNLE